MEKPPRPQSISSDVIIAYLSFSHEKSTAAIAFSERVLHEERLQGLRIELDCVWRKCR